jgi:streptogramin lyase
VARYTASVEKRFQSPGPQPNGLQAADDGLWVIDQVTLQVHKLDWETGKVIHEFDTETEHSSGITFGGGALWISSTFGLEIVKVDPENGKTLARYPDPGVGFSSLVEGTESARKSSSHGLEWRDGKIYAAAPPTQRVHVIDVETWEEINQFPTGGLRVHGIGWNQDGRLWVSDTSAGTVQLMQPDSGRIYDVFRVDEPDEVHGMTVFNGDLWYCDAGTRDIGILRRQTP